MSWSRTGRCAKNRKETRRLYSHPTLRSRGDLHSRKLADRAPSSLLNPRGMHHQRITDVLSVSAGPRSWARWLRSMRALLAQGRRRTNFIRAGPSTSLRFAQDDSSRGRNEKAPAKAGAFSFAPDGESAGGGIVFSAGYSAAISSASPSWRISSSSRSASSKAVFTSSWTLAAASSSSGESEMLR